jgi:hypothetical protein
METLDNQMQVSCGYVLYGQIGDLKRLREVILKFLGAEMMPDGHIHQATPSTSIRLIYHTLSRDRLFVTKEKFGERHPVR